VVVALVSWLLWSAVEVVGNGDCPSVAAVTRRLDEMVPARAREGAPRHRAQLSRVEGAVHVELLSARGDLLGERDLAAGDSCSDLAGAVAVVIAAWEADLDPRLAARVSLPAPSSPPAPLSAPAAVAVQATLAAPRPPPAFDVGLALLASLSGGQLAPGARIGGWVAPPGSRLGLAVSMSAVTTRAESVGARAEAARWSRVAFAAGPQAKFRAGRTTLDAQLQALAAVLRVEGVGLTTNQAATAAQLGMAAGVHVGRWWGNARPWIGVDLLLWPGRDRLEIAGQTAHGELPRLEVQFAFGVNMGRVP
jgi:hypothetical protein